MARLHHGSRTPRGLAAALALAALLAGGCAAAPAASPPSPPPPGSGAPAARPTVVSLTFDDGSAGQYLVRSILLDHGLRATFYVNSGLVDRADGSTMTWDQIRGLAADGNDIGGHTLTHASLPELSSTERQHQVCDDRARLVALGLRPESFAYPTGATDPRIEETVRSCGYTSARTVGDIAYAGEVHAEPLPPRDPFATDALGPPARGPIDAAYLHDAVRTTASRGGGWLQIVFHRVCRPSSADYAACMASEGPVDIGVLSDFVAWLATSAPAGTVVTPVAEVVARD
ncbi:polysaccharide deacetylase family protein [Actinomycetospora lutea]|uniref:polysaccharide deacetylase family protein n=1 Tax=Actinomycetospora lutea TaxID=663604 RepID=UPI0023667ACE|nr:polysaccharide deacetylase family protein [Actinomycetospora lutea]MDD7941999.1 polysaccharide deacetylase family protein [Actinomycetospora lutea]